MERTLKALEEELRLAREERKPLYEVVNAIDKKIEKLKDEIVEYKLNNELYHPMSELIDYLGKNIDSITLVERKEDGTLKTDFLYRDGIFSVTEYGNFYYSSYDGGIISYDHKARKYVHMYHYSKFYHDYVGFLEIEIEEDDED